MEMRDGMLGVVIIALAITVALFGSYLAGVTSSEVEVTKYNYLADVSGLFEYDKSPQYIEFDPSTNYTGYHSNEANTEYGEFWPKDQVDYTRNINTITGEPRPNNYKITTAPYVGASSTVNLQAVDVELKRMTIRYVYDIQGDNVMWLGPGPETASVMFKDTIESLYISETATNLRITLGDSVNWNDMPTAHVGAGLELNLDTVLILPYTSETVYVTSPDRSPSTIENLTVKVTQPYQSFDVNLKEWTVTCYRTPDFSGTADTMSADSLAICYGPATLPPLFYDRLNLADTMKIRTLTYNDPTYLDPNYGVSLMDPIDPNSVPIDIVYNSNATITVNGVPYTGTTNLYTTIYVPDGSEVSWSVTARNGYEFASLTVEYPGDADVYDDDPYGTFTADEEQYVISVQLQEAQE